MSQVHTSADEHVRHIESMHYCKICKFIRPDDRMSQNDPLQLRSNIDRRFSSQTAPGNRQRLDLAVGEDFSSHELVHLRFNIVQELGIWLQMVPNCSLLPLACFVKKKKCLEISSKHLEFTQKSQFCRNDWADLAVEWLISPSNPLSARLELFEAFQSSRIPKRPSSKTTMTKKKC